MVRVSKKARKYISVGAWIRDTPKDLPKIEEPESLPRDRNLDNRELAHYISWEGLGYCIYYYISSNKIDDPKLKKLWGEARKGLQKVVDYMFKWELDNMENLDDSIGSV